MLAGEASEVRSPWSTMPTPPTRTLQVLRVGHGGPLFKKWITTYSLGDAIITPTPIPKALLESYGLRGPSPNFQRIGPWRALGPLTMPGRSLGKGPAPGPEDFVVMGVGLYIERKGIPTFWNWLAACQI